MKKKKIRVLVDTRQQAGKHELTHKMLVDEGCELISICLPYGDYMLWDGDDPPTKEDIEDRHLIAVDTKQGMQEIYNNLVGSHARFRRECEKACGRLIVLDGGGDCNALENVHRWQNPRVSRYYQNKAYGREVPKWPPVSSKRLQVMMETMRDKHGVRWEFCKPEESAGKIMQLLGIQEQD